MMTRRYVMRLLAGAGLAGVSTAAYGFAVEPNMLNVTRYNLAPPQWPAGFELKIAAITDIHACDPWMSLERIGEIVTRTNQLGADIIVLLGDYVTRPNWLMRDIAAPAWAEVLAGLKAPLGVHAILGNHDYWQDKPVMRAGGGVTFARRALEGAGIPVYENDVARLSHNGHPFWLAGLADQVAFLPLRRQRRGKPLGLDDLAGTLAKVTDDAPVILLAHEPDIAVDVPDRVALQLSGHTHGGQVNLFGWAPATPTDYPEKFTYGYAREKCDVIISAGVGFSGLPIRIGAPPEIVLVTLGGGAPAA